MDFLKTIKIVLEEYLMMWRTPHSMFCERVWLQKKIYTIAFKLYLYVYASKMLAGY